MMPPFFKKLDPACGTELYQTIPDQASLPWTFIDTGPPTGEGEFGFVRKVRIHSDQHNLVSRLLILPTRFPHSKAFSCGLERMPYSVIDRLTDSRHHIRDKKKSILP